MGKYYYFFLNLIPMPPGQSWFLSKSWDFSYLSFTFSFCAELASRVSSSRSRSSKVGSRRKAGAFPVLQELLWLLCIFKGLTLSHGEPL